MLVSRKGGSWYSKPSTTPNTPEHSSLTSISLQVRYISSINLGSRRSKKQAFPSEQVKRLHTRRLPYILYLLTKDKDSIFGLSTKQWSFVVCLSVLFGQVEGIRTKRIGCWQLEKSRLWSNGMGMDCFICSIGQPDKMSTLNTSAAEVKGDIG